MLLLVFTSPGKNDANTCFFWSWGVFAPLFYALIYNSAFNQKNKKRLLSTASPLSLMFKCKNSLIGIGYAKYSS